MDFGRSPKGLGFGFHSRNNNGHCGISLTGRPEGFPRTDKGEAGVWE